MPPSLVPRKAPHACNVDVYLNAARISEISDASTEVVTFGDRQPRCGFAVHRRAVDLVAPPDELDAVIRESEEDDDGGESRARVERRAEEIVVLLSPGESSPADRIVEHETGDEPERILGAGSGRNVAGRVEEDRYVHIAKP